MKLKSFKESINAQTQDVCVPIVYQMFYTRYNYVIHAALFLHRFLCHYIFAVHYISFRHYH